jgi:hypothetical protein
MLAQRLVPVLAAACAGAALLAPGIARAAPPLVAFHGGCGLLGVGASSQPDRSSVTVSSGGTVTFVNHLDQSAHLMINGADRGVVPQNNQVAVLFRSGRVSVSMLPGCLLQGGGSVGAVTVTVAAVPDVPSPSTEGSSAGRPAPTPDRSPSARSASPSPSPSEPSAGAASQAPDGAAPSVEALAGTGPAVAPSADAVVGAAVPGPPGRPRPAGLLVVVAGICVVGVSAAAIRVMIAQRAIRAVAT